MTHAPTTHANQHADTTSEATRGTETHPEVVRSETFEGLMRRRWTRQVLQVLAARGPQRYSDLLRELALLDQGTVHGKSLAAALPFLRETGLIEYRRQHPRDGVYVITDVGAGVLTRLREVERYVAEQVGA